MKRTYLVCKEGAEGCDYSLCCGKLYSIYEGKGESLDEDIKILFEEIAYPEGRSGEDSYFEFDKNHYDITDVFVVPIKTEIITMNIEQYKKDWEKERKKKELKGREDKEREQYERLKKKYGE